METTTAIEVTARCIEAAGVIAIVAGGAIAIVLGALRLRSHNGAEVYRAFRHDLGRAIIVGLVLACAAFGQRRPFERIAAQRPSTPPLLKKELERPTITPEVRLRIEHLLKLREPEGMSPERARLDHAIRVLEYIATPEARKLLAELAKNESDMHLASQSQLALKRLSQRAD
jgi:hypothetical protein